MNINGKTAWHASRLSAAKGNKLIVRPLPGLLVIRDSGRRYEHLLLQYEKVKPYLQNDTPAWPSSVQSPEEREKLHGLYECILCACYRPLPVLLVEPDSLRVQLHRCKFTASWQIQP